MSPLGVPDLVAQINELRASAGVGPLTPMAVSTTIAGHTILGQGGYAQQWAEHIATQNRMVHSLVSANEAWWNTNTPAPAGKTWDCLEVLAGSARSPSSSVAVGFWAQSAGHRAIVTAAGATHVGVGAMRADDGTQYFVAQPCYLTDAGPGG